MKTTRKRKLSFLWGLVVLFFASTCIPSFGFARDVSSYSGNGYVGAANGPSSTASFHCPYGIVVDPEGNLLVMDSENNLIRQISGGTTSTLAGVLGKPDLNGKPVGGFKDGEAAEALFNNPRYGDLNLDGDLFLSDSGSNLIRKISVGTVSTVAGTGKAGYLDGTRKTAQFNRPAGIAVDSYGNIFVADSLNHVIRIISPNGAVATFAGKNTPNGGYQDGPSKEAQFNEPSDLAFDSKGALYVLDSGNQMLRKVYKGNVTTVLGAPTKKLPGTNYMTGALVNGSGANVRMNFPKGLCIAENDTIFIADTWNNVVRALTPEGKLLTIAGTGKSGVANGKNAVASFDGPVDVAISGNTLYVSELWNHEIRSININLKKLEGLSVGLDPAKGLKLKKKGKVPQVWVDGKNVKLPKNGYLSDKSNYYLSPDAVAKAVGGKATFDKAKGELTLSNGGYSLLLKKTDGSIRTKGSLTGVEIHTLGQGLGYSVYYVREKNAILFYSE